MGSDFRSSTSALRFPLGRLFNFQSDRFAPGRFGRPRRRGVAENSERVDGLPQLPERETSDQPDRSPASGSLVRIRIEN